MKTLSATLRAYIAELMDPLVLATRRFIPPSLCGCELNLTAKWVKRHFAEGPRTGAVMYQHPVPGTITKVEAVHVCAEHRGWQTKAVPFAPYTLEHHEPNWSAGYILEPYKALLRDAGRLSRLGSKAALKERDRVLATALAMHRQWAQALTADARLYIHLFRYVGNKATLDCGCTSYRCVNWYEPDDAIVLEHPVHTTPCFTHRWLRERKAA